MYLNNHIKKFSFDNLNDITITNIYGDYNIVDLKNKRIISSSSTGDIQNKRYFICIPHHIFAYGIEYVSFKHALNYFILSLSDDSKTIACFYGKSPIKSKTVTKNNNITNMGSESINTYLSNIFDVILKQTDKTEYITNIVYLFVNKPEDYKDFNKIREYKIPNHIILKIILLDKIISRNMSIKI